MDIRSKKSIYWIFQILTGKKPEETTLKNDKYKIKEVREFYRRINAVEFHQGLKPEKVEQILAGNYYVGMSVYRYIMKHYFEDKSISIDFGISTTLRIRAATSKGKIIILIPDFEDEDF